MAIEEDLFAFQREYLGKHIIIIANRAEKPQTPFNLSVLSGGIKDGSPFFDPITGSKTVISEGVLPLDMHPQGASVWIEK